jgi:hypothetical protein
MGNALVVGIVTKVAEEWARRIEGSTLTETGVKWAKTASSDR